MSTIALDSNSYDPGKAGASKAAGDVCKGSFQNSPFAKIHEFSGRDFQFRDPRGWTYTDALPYVAQIKERMHAQLDAGLFEQATSGIFLPQGYKETLCADGTGTKVEMANALYSLIKKIEDEHQGYLSEGFRGMARNLIAMSADDIVRYGGLPLIFANVIDYSKLDEDNAMAYRELMLGLGDICREQGIVILTGESAQLGQFVGSQNPNAFFPFNWSGVLHGLYHDNLMITGNEVRAGDHIIALEQEGVRSNGLTKLREALTRKYGPEWYYNIEALKDVIEALTPSVVYAKLIADANGWYSNGEKKVNITSFSHLSGGGLTDKLLKEVLMKQGLSAELNSLYRIPEIVRKSIEWLIGAPKPVNLKKAHDVWSVGQGAVLTVRSMKDVDTFLALAQEHKKNAQYAGQVIETPKGQSPHLDITARFKDGSNEQQFKLFA